MKLFIFLSVFIFIGINSFAQKSHKGKITYAGHVEYAQGNFNSYNYPVKNDTIILTIDKDDSLSLFIGSRDKQRIERSFNFKSLPLKLTKKEMYDNIITMDKIIPSGNYDRKYEHTSSGSTITVRLSHYGDGTYGQLNISIESNNLRLNDLIIAEVVKQ